MPFVCIQYSRTATCQSFEHPFGVRCRSGSEMQPIDVAALEQFTFARRGLIEHISDEFEERTA